MKRNKAKKAKLNNRCEETRMETKSRKRAGRRIVLTAVCCILAVLFYFPGRIIYLGVINPGAAFDTALHAGNMAASAESATAVTDEAPVASGNTPAPGGNPVQNTAQAPAQSVGTPAPSPVETPAPSQDEEQAALSQADLDFIKDKVNILLVGVDENRQREKTRSGFCSDVLLLLCIDFKEKIVHMLSIPRDSYAAIYNTKGKWKINSAFSHGGGIGGNGFQYCMMSVSMLLGGIPVHYYAGVQMEGLKKLIDTLGGVDYKVDIPVKMNGRYLKKGLQHLTGQQVLDYCRIRKGIGTDVNRVDRQQRLLLSLFKQLQSENKLTLIPRAFEALKGDIYTNLSLEQVLALAVFSANVDAKAIKRHTLKGKYMFAYGSKYYFLDQSAKTDVVYDIFGIRIKANYLYDASYVKAFTEAGDAVKAADKLLSKYKSKMTDAEKTAVGDMAALVTGERKKLPNNMKDLSALVKQLNSLCYQTEKVVRKRAAPPSSSQAA
jgi:LCP family protein required for cell wall assembly